MENEARGLTTDRIKSLDITRGVAVMGIFSVNVVAMAMIQIAYFFPPAFGFSGAADHGIWLVNFLLIDGKLRSLFSMMFGASVLLIVDRAVATGRSPAKTHYARMIVLLLIGYLHWMLFWWGDILTHYAAVGMVIFLFRKATAKTLLIVSTALFLLYAAPSAWFTHDGIEMSQRIESGQATPKDLERAGKARDAFYPNAEVLAADDSAHDNLMTHTNEMLTEEGPAKPFDFGPLWLETLGLMLLGMGLYRSGFLTGSLDPAFYRKVALLTLTTGFAGFAAAAAFAIAHDHRPAYQMAAYGGYTPLLRPWMATGYAALIILLSRRGQASGWWATHFAAVGRTAFSNYLFCTLIGTFLFFGFAGDLYLKLSRFESWLIVPPVWLAMLLWSKWWLDRFQYGPLEWVWRSLARWQVQPMRRSARASATLSSE